jgi:hypothetical protein
VELLKSLAPIVKSPIDLLYDDLVTVFGNDYVVKIEGCSAVEVERSTFYNCDLGNCIQLARKHKANFYISDNVVCFHDIGQQKVLPLEECIATETKDSITFKALSVDSVNGFNGKEIELKKSPGRNNDHEHLEVYKDGKYIGYFHITFLDCSNVQSTWCPVRL